MWAGLACIKPLIRRLALPPGSLGRWRRLLVALATSVREPHARKMGSRSAVPVFRRGQFCTYCEESEGADSLSKWRGLLQSCGMHPS